jgi:hypothetical protein
LVSVGKLGGSVSLPIRVPGVRNPTLFAIVVPRVQRLLGQIATLNRAGIAGGQSVDKLPELPFSDISDFEVVSR